MTGPLRRILISLLTAVAAYALVGAAIRGVVSAPTRCPDRATGPASVAPSPAPLERGASIAGRGPRR